MVTPGRSFSAGSQYRYGFNGKENDKNISDGAQDYGFRIYDIRLGKFLSVDPLSSKYPMLTPYQFASNSPLSGIDLDGKEFYYAADGKFLGKMGKETSIRIVHPEFLKNQIKLLANVKMTLTQGFKNVNDGTAYDAKGAKADFYNNSSETYASRDDAAADFGLMNNSISIVNNAEYAAKIGSVQLKNSSNTLFILGSLVHEGGGADNVDINSSDLFGTLLVGGSHTHGADPRIPGYHVNSFSGSALPQLMGLNGDMDWANNNKVPIYLIDPKGELKIYLPKLQYSTGDENGQPLRTDMPYDIHGSSGDPKVKRPAYDFNIIYDKHQEPTSSDAIPYKLPVKK